MKLKSLIKVGFFALPLSLISCKDAQDAAGAATDAVGEAKDAAVEKVTGALPTDAEGIASLVVDKMGEITGHLEGVTDVESAKKILPELDKIGGVMKSLKENAEKIGGDAKMMEVMGSNEEIKKKMEGVMGKMMGKMMELGQKSPEAMKLINDKMESIMK